MTTQSFFQLHDMFFKAVDECIAEGRAFSFTDGVDCTGQPAPRSTHFYNGESYARHPGYVVPLTVTMGKQTPAMTAMHNAYNAAPFEGRAFSTCAHQCTDGTTTELETYYPPKEEKPMAALKEMETEGRAMLADSRDYHELEPGFVLVRFDHQVWLCRATESVALEDQEKLTLVASLTEEELHERHVDAVINALEPSEQSRMQSARLAGGIGLIKTQAGLYGDEDEELGLVRDFATLPRNHRVGFCHRAGGDGQSRKRVEFRPDWSIVHPWVSYRNGTAGRSFPNEVQALEWLKG